MKNQLAFKFLPKLWTSIFLSCGDCYWLIHVFIKVLEYYDFHLYLS